jgi:hypothetical protein
VCRPLDKPLIPMVNGEAVNFDQDIEAAADDIDE